jgi:hypothetical protein
MSLKVIQNRQNPIVTTYYVFLFEKVDLFLGAAGGGISGLVRWYVGLRRPYL